MSSGKRESVLLFCISPIDKLYLDPIEYYEPDIIHVFIGNREDRLSFVERKMYKSSKEKIACKNVIEHCIDTSDYEETLGTIIDIKKELYKKYGRDLDFFINISSGTPEFSAAGMFASMLPQPAIAFKVDADNNLSSEELTIIADKLNNSVKISEPERVTGLRNDEPEDEMISFLKVIDDILKASKYPKYRAIIDGLKAADAWSYDPNKKAGYGRTPPEVKEERYLKRHYIAEALENGWIERPSPKTMRLTDSGKAYISVYGKEKDHRRIPVRDCLYSTTRFVDSDNLEHRALFDESTDHHRIMNKLKKQVPESNTVTFGRKKKHTFRIEMD